MLLNSLDSWGGSVESCYVTIHSNSNDIQSYMHCLAIQCASGIRTTTHATDALNAWVPSFDWICIKLNISASLPSISWISCTLSPFLLNSLPLSYPPCLTPGSNLGPRTIFSEPNTLLTYSAITTYELFSVLSPLLRLPRFMISNRVIFRLLFLFLLWVFVQKTFYG